MASRLTPTSVTEIRNQRTYRLYMCSCGKQKTISQQNVRSGKVKSCGCIRSEVTSKRNRKDIYFNEFFFSKIDSEEKSYWLGFIMADGCVTASHRLQIELQSRDVFHLKKFIVSLSSNLSIHRVYDRGFSISVASNSIASDLEKYGVTKRKSLSLKPNTNQIPEEYLRDFWRGVIDGDGSIFFSGGKQYIGLVGTLHTTEAFIGFASRLGAKVKSPVKRGSVFTVRFSGKEAFLIADVLYKDSSMYLERKYKKYTEMKTNAI